MKNDNNFFYFIKYKPRHKHAKWLPSDLNPWTLTLFNMHVWQKILLNSKYVICPLKLALNSNLSKDKPTLISYFLFHSQISCKKLAFFFYRYQVKHLETHISHHQNLLFFQFSFLLQIKSFFNESFEKLEKLYWSWVQIDRKPFTRKPVSTLGIWT